MSTLSIYTAALSGLLSSLGGGGGGGDIKSALSGLTGLLGKSLILSFSFKMNSYKR